MHSCLEPSNSVGKRPLVLSTIASEQRFVTNSFLAFLRLFTSALLLLVSPLAPLRAETTVAAETVSTSLSDAETKKAEPASLQSTEQPPVQPWSYPANLHAWARFPLGAWREIEVTTETYDENGKLFGRSVTTQREILKAIASDGYVLEVQATVDVAGKRIEGPWNTRVLRLSTDRSGTIFSSVRHADELLALNVGAVNCQVWELRSTEESHIKLDRVYFSPELFPHLLRRDVIKQSENSPIEAPPLDSTTTLARAVPYVLDGRIVECANQVTVRRREKGDSQTLALLSPLVPGGEVRSRTTDFDSVGRRIRWSVQKLISYGSSPASEAAFSGPQK